MFDKDSWLGKVLDKYAGPSPKEEKKKEPISIMGVNPFVNPKRLTDLLKVEANILLVEGRECYGN
jgi:hypothetical protein